MRRFIVMLIASAVLGAAVPAAAQGLYEPLFDRFNFKIEGSFVDLATIIRLDSEVLGKGTELRFEDDLGLSAGKIVPSLSFEWQIARRHRLAARWQDVDRKASHQALTEIHWGDDIIPIEANIGIAFDIATYAVDYTYYPWIKERWAGGFGLGFRILDVTALLSVDDVELDSDINASAPLPYVNFEYRRKLSERWRMKAGIGWLAVTVGDISGSQYIGRLAFEYQTRKRWGFGAAINLSNVDVDWEGLKNPEGEPVLTGRLDFDINDVSLYIRLRFGH